MQSLELGGLPGLYQRTELRIKRTPAISAGAGPAEIAGVRLIASGLNRPPDKYGKSKTHNIPKAERRSQVEYREAVINAFVHNSWIDGNAPIVI